MSVFTFSVIHRVCMLVCPSLSTISQKVIDSFESMLYNDTDLQPMTNRSHFATDPNLGLDTRYFSILPTWREMAFLDIK